MVTLLFLLVCVFCLMAFALSDTTMVLTDVANILRHRYFDDKWHEGFRSRIGISKYLDWKKLLINGKTARFQVKTRPYTGARFGSLEAALGTPTKFDGVEVVVHLGKSTSDLCRLTASIQYDKEVSDVTDYDGLISKIADELIMGAREDMIEHIGQAPWLGANGKLFTMDGVAQDDDGTALGNGDVDFRFSVLSTSGSPTFAIPNLSIDFYSGATLKFGVGGDTLNKDMMVTDVKPDTTTIGKWWIYCRARDGTANGSAVTLDSLDIYRSGEYTKGPLSFNQWWNVAADGGVDSIFRDDAGSALNRTSPATAAYWLPLTHQAHASLSNLQLEDIDWLGPVLAREGATGAITRPVIVGNPEMWINVKRLMEFSKRTILPMNQDVQKVFGVDGVTDMVFVDPIFGNIGVTGDVYCPANLLQIINPDVWGYLESGPPEWLAHGVGGIWESVSDTTTMYAAWRADLYQLYQILCFGPRRGNYRITNVRSVNT